MRVTNSMMRNNSLLNMQKNKNAYNKYLMQYNTQSQIQRPSDDPTIAVRALKYRTTLAEVTQYLKNIDDAIRFLELKEGNTRINIKIKGEVETAINADGPIINDYSIALLLKKIDDLTNDDIVIIAGNVPKNIDSSIYALICKKLYDKNIPFIVDACDKNLIDVLKYNPFLIKPNKEELESTLGVKINNINDLRKTVLKLKEMGALNVLVSLGSDGAFLVDDSLNEYVLDAPSINVVNTVGAGDSMLAGFIYGFLKNRNYGEALMYGVACGSATAQCDDLATLDIIELMLDKINN